MHRDGYFIGYTHLLNHKVGKVWNNGHGLTLDLENVSSEDLFGSSVYHISHQRGCGRAKQIAMISHITFRFSQVTFSVEPKQSENNVKS